MRNYLIIILFAALAGCSKANDVDLLFDGLPEERMAERLKELQDKLLEAPNGWNVSLPTTGKGAYGFYMKFNEDQTVDMVADLTNSSAVTMSTSTYRIKWVMNASLIFDTYNYITMLQDPNPSVYGGAAGSGLKSDIEFEYIRSAGDSMILRGKKYQNNLVLIKASASEQAQYESGALLDIVQSYQDFFATHYNNYVLVTTKDGEQKVALTYNHSDKKLTYQVVEEDRSVTSGSGKFFYSTNGIGLATDFSYKGINFISGRFKSGGKSYLYDAAGNEYEILQNPVPLTPVLSIFGYNKTYKALYVGTSLPGGVSSGFNALYQSAIAKFAAMNPSRTLLDLKFTFTNSNTATITIRNTNGTSTYTGNAIFSYTLTEDGTLTLSNPSYDNNWAARVNELIDVQNFFTSRGPFKVDYASSSTDPTKILGGLYSIADPGIFFYGTFQ